MLSSHAFKDRDKSSFSVGQSIKRCFVFLRNLSHLPGYVLSMHQSEAVLLNTPLHGNIGDHAIALSELEYLSGLGLRIIDFPWSKHIMKLLAMLTPKDMLILLHGGGYLGSLWPNEEKTARRVLRAFRKHRIIILPQTVYFDLDSEEDRAFFEESKSVYAAHSALTLFVRERYSYDFVKTNLSGLRTELVPDMVMLLKYECKAVRHGALVCLRNDLERTLSDSERDTLLNTLSILGVSLRKTDTCVDRPISLTERSAAVKEKLDEFASAEFVITDRLHGMVFAAITETPCIVLNSKSHKLKGCYEWLKGLDYIRFAENTEALPQLIESFITLQDQNLRFPYEQFEKEMEPLKRALLK